MILYIDPGTGSMLFSLGIGLLSVLWFGARKLYMKVKYLKPRRRVTDSNVLPLVIYSDDKRYWKYLEPICREMDKREIGVVYMTASDDDPALSNTYPHIKGEFIGKGNRPYTKLNFLKATLLLTTTPGLEVYQWKRSKDVSCYIHIPHGANAMTFIRMFGTDFFDVLLLSGQYQFDNTRKLEELRHLPEKELIFVGVPYMDDIIARLAETSQPRNSETTVLLAPSWGNTAIFRRFGGKIIDLLLETGYHIIVRPHPQSFISETEMIEELMLKYPETNQLEWNNDLDNFDVLNRADILISDFSGTVFEFALAYDKPVICVDVHFDDAQYDSCWLETGNWTINTLPRIAMILTENNQGQIKEMIDQCLTDETFRSQRHQVCDEAWIHRGEGAVRVADYLERKYTELTGQSLREAGQTHED